MIVGDKIWIKMQINQVFGIGIVYLDTIESKLRCIYIDIQRGLYEYTALKKMRKEKKKKYPKQG